MRVAFGCHSRPPIHAHLLVLVLHRTYRGRRRQAFFQDIARKRLTVFGHRHPLEHFFKAELVKCQIIITFQHRRNLHRSILSQHRRVNLLFIVGRNQFHRSARCRSPVVGRGRYGHQAHLAFGQQRRKDGIGGIAGFRTGIYRIVVIPVFHRSPRLILVGKFLEVIPVQTGPCSRIGRIGLR